MLPFIFWRKLLYIYMAYKGKFKPQNPQKYRGDPTNIVYRSSWECKVMSRLDRDTNVIEWASEEFFIPYRSPVDGKMHRYFPDFFVRVQSNSGLRAMVWEVKPKKQAQPPQPRSRVTKQYINEVVTWGINEAKWKAAQEFCKDRGWEFKVLTEDDLGIR
jgi:hypothetical protein